MILATNVLVAALGMAVGWLAIEAAGREIERKLLHEPVAGAARLVEAESLPPYSDSLMQRLSMLLGAETASTLDAPQGIVAASLPAEKRRLLAAELARDDSPRRVVLGDETYRVVWAKLRPPPGDRGPGRYGPMRLYLLVPEPRVIAAKEKVSGRIALVTVLAVVVATGVGSIIAATISRPVRKLAARMDHLAAEARGAGEAGAGPAGRAARYGGPAEVARLAESFDQLLTRLAEARAELARSTRLAALGELSAAVAHELRNPLSGIRMNAQILAEELSRQGAADESLELIIREADRMDLYVQELLALAADGHARAEPAPARPQRVEAPIPLHRDWGPLRLDELARSVAALLAGRCRHAGLTVETDFAPAGACAAGSEMQLRQVIMNLMINAIDAMPHGGTIRLRTSAGGGGTVRFSVSDSGEGVQSPPGADIFEPFVTTRARGAGLGLHICRKIVTRHAGRIGYDSTPDGATFWFDLPQAEGDG